LRSNLSSLQLRLLQTQRPHAQLRSTDAHRKWVDVIAIAAFDREQSEDARLQSLRFDRSNLRTLKTREVEREIIAVYMHHGNSTTLLMRIGGWLQRMSYYRG
jgi:hypothetical protein